jgi:acyl carrier protein
VPRYIFQLEYLPLNANGKIDKRQLLENYSFDVRQQDYVAPRNALEKLLVQIWQNFLGNQVIGIQDDFFELGGHSLLAAKLVAEIKKTTGFDVPLRTLFELNTIISVARWIELNRRDSAFTLQDFEEIKL